MFGWQLDDRNAHIIMTEMVSTPPNGGLYKFLMLFGLILVVFAFSYPPLIIRQDASQTATLEKEMDVARIAVERKRDAVEKLRNQFQPEIQSEAEEKNALQKAQAALDDKTRALEKQNSAQHNVSPTYLDALNHVKEEQDALVSEVAVHQKNIDELKGKLKPLRQAEAEADYESQMFGVQLNWQTRLVSQLTMDQMFHLIASAIFACTGIILCRRGFVLWHRKIQCYHDALLEKQARDAGITLKDAGSKRDPT